MTPPRTLKQADGVCAAHGQFELLIEEKFDRLGAAVDGVASGVKDAVQEIKGITKSLSDGRVEFTSQDGRLVALEKQTQDCALDRERMKTDIKFLTRGYWMALGALAVLQLILKYFWN